MGSTDKRTHPAGVNGSARDARAALARAWDELRAGDGAAAERRCREILAHHPRNGEALHLLGVRTQSEGRHQEAAELFLEAAAAAPENPNFRHRLGVALRALGRTEDSVECFRIAVELSPDWPDAQVALGNSLKALGRHEEAVEAHRAALALSPYSAEIWSDLALAYKAWGRHGESILCLERARTIAPECAEIRYNLGNALLAADRFEEAERSFRDALGLTPEHLGALVNLGVALKEQGRLGAAAVLFRRAIELRPDHADAHWNLALALLMAGTFDQGWEAYEWRRRIHGFPVRRLDGPEWDGAIRPGLRLLFHSEQGLGDTIQFVRYARPLAEAGVRVSLSCPRRLARLLGTSAGVESIVPDDRAAPPADAQLPLMSAPLRHGALAGPTPSPAPYLSAEPELVNRWRARLGEGQRTLKIGIAWQGNPAYQADRRRSIPLAKFAPLARLAGVRLYGLQVGPGREQLAAAGDTGWFVDLGSELDRGSDAFVDTAAVMASLDLVISSDTAVPHLAGALGREVWLLLPRVPDWRWGLSGESTPWYPTMRLFRQSRAGDWDGVFAEVADALGRRAA
ncbi:MAG: tetratricopeptide repeat protein [Alphaproteobacteria bacterium]